MDNKDVVELDKRDVVENRIVKYFEWISHGDFERRSDYCVPVYTKYFKICNGSRLQCDFILFHPYLAPSNLIIEVVMKNVHQTIENVKELYPYETIIIVDNKARYSNTKPQFFGDNNLLQIFSLFEFFVWFKKTYEHVPVVGNDIL